MMNVNVGCGHNLLEDWVNVDINPQTGCDVVAAVPPMPFGDETVDTILASHFIEHIPTEKKIELFNEFWRVLKPGGVLDLFVPHAQKWPAIADPTHVSFWVTESGLYFREQMAYLKYGIRVWSVSDWNLIDNDWIIKGHMVK